MMRKTPRKAIVLTLAALLALSLPAAALASPIASASCGVYTAKVYSGEGIRLTMPSTAPRCTAEPTIDDTPVPPATEEPVLSTPTPDPIDPPASVTPVVPAPVPVPVPVPPDYTQGTCSAQAQVLLAWINQDRANYGRAPIVLDGELCGAAELKSQDMYDNNYFAHESPTYGSSAAMLKTLGIAVNASGENIAKHATIEKSHAAFMSSEGHRNNILSSSWTKMGIGVKQANGYVLVTEIFAR